MTPLSVFSALLVKLEALGGEISTASTSGNGFLITVNHPDVNINLGAHDTEVQIRCRKGMFPVTRAHVDVDDIMTVIQGWMKEAGGGCTKYGEDNTLSSGNWSAPLNQSPGCGGKFRKPVNSRGAARCGKCGALDYEAGDGDIHVGAPLAPGVVATTFGDGKRRLPSAMDERRAELLRQKRREWGVDRPHPPESSFRPLSDRKDKPYCVIIIRNLRGTPNQTNSEEHWLKTLADAQWMVREAKLDPLVGHIELTDHRPGGKEWYYDRDRSGFWKRTVHN